MRQEWVVSRPGGGNRPKQGKATREGTGWINGTDCGLFVVEFASWGLRNSIAATSMENISQKGINSLDTGLRARLLKYIRSKESKDIAKEENERVFQARLGRYASRHSLSRG